jgi:hypothetical protein
MLIPALLWALAAPQETAEGAERAFELFTRQASPDEPAGPPSAGHTLSVVFRSKDWGPDDGVDAPIYRATVRMGDFFPLDKSHHEGIRRAVQAVEPMPRFMAPEAPHLWLRIYIYTHDDGHTWAEVAVGNDSMADPIGYLFGDVAVFLGARQIGFRKNAQLFDQTGAVMRFGDTRLAPIEEIVRRAQVNYPEGLELPFEWGYYSNLFQWGNPDCRGEDHHAWTHKTGSPGNMFWPWELDGCWQYYFLHPPEEGDSVWWPRVHRLSRTMVRFAQEQYGTWHLDCDGVRIFHPGRTYHLFRYTKGQPVESYDGREPYSFDHPAGFHARTSEGVISLRLGRNMPHGWHVETFGRIGLERYHVENKETEGPNAAWMFKRISGMGYRGYSSVGGPWWGWDHEHHTNERLFAAAICTPSEIARTELINLANSTMRGSDGAGRPFDYHGTYTTGWDHSSRTLGWVGRMYWRAWMVTGNPAYRDICRAMLDLWFRVEPDGRRGVEASNRWPPMHRDAAFPFALTRYANGGARMWDDGQNPVEACWQASVAAMFFWLMYEQEEDLEWKERAGAAAFEICEGVIETLEPGVGFHENYGIRFRTPDGRPLFGGNSPSLMGTAHWVPDAMAMAWHYSGHDARFEPVRDFWLNRYLKRNRYPYFGFGSRHGHDWHRYCAKFFGGWESGGD